MKRAVWFEPAGIPGMGLRAVDLGPAWGIFGWVGMRRVLFRDVDGKCCRMNFWPSNLTCER